MGFFFSFSALAHSRGPGSVLPEHNWDRAYGNVMRWKMPRTKFTDAAQREMLHPWASCTKGPLTFGDYKTHTHLLQCSSLQTSSPRWLSSPQLRWPLCSPIVTFQACGLGASGQGEGGRGQAVPPPAAHCPPQGPMKPCPERGALSMEHLVIKMGGKKLRKS